MKRRVVTRSKPIQHQLDVTHVEQRDTRGDFALIGPAVAPVPPMSGVRAVNHPAVLQ